MFDWAVGRVLGLDVSGAGIKRLGFGSGSWSRPQSCCLREFTLPGSKAQGH